MKQIICALLSIFLITPCMANIHIHSEIVEAVIKQKIDGTDAQIAALTEYNAQIKNAGGKDAGVPAAGIWSVCKAIGWNSNTTEGKSKCNDFRNTLSKYASRQFSAVCGKDSYMVELGTGKCVDDVFSNKFIGGVKVNMLIAPGLAKEYARVKYNDNNLVCSKNPRKSTLDDFIQCISMDKNMAYEFKFDSITATNDAEINASTEAGVCKIYDIKYSPSGITLDTAYSKGESWSAACETTDATVCNKINESMKRFGRSAKIGTTGSKGNQHSACIIKTDGVSPTTLRTAFGIDNHAFKKGGIQLNATNAVKIQVCDYVRKTVTNPTITSCVCNDGFTQMYDFSSLITETDDVLTCTINGKPVDFVFDDLSEANKKVAAGGSQGMDCMAAGGTYSGQRCINLNAEQCNLLASANIKNCPNCKRVKFDPKTNSCVLPSSADAANIQKNTNIALIVGGAVVGVGVTVMTGGAGAVVVLTGIETVGAAIELGAQLKIDAIADEFLVKSNQCKSESCARSLIKNNFQHLADSQNDFSAPEISAIDNEMARLANMIPENDDFWADMALSGLSMADNQSGVFENWTPEQVWRAVGITLQMASVVTSVGKWVGTKTKTVVTKLSKSSEVLKTKTEKVIDVVEHATGRRTLTAKQLEVRQRLTNKLTVTIPDFLQNVKNVQIIGTKGVRSGVYKFENMKTGRIYFLKYNTDTYEIERTLRAYEILSSSNVTSGSRIIETDVDIIRAFAKANDINIPDGRIVFIMENALEESNMIPAWDLISGNVESAMNQIGKKAITIKEQELILEDIKRLNDAGIKHGDILQNMYIYRNSHGNIKVSLMDYESWGTRGYGNKDIEDVKSLLSDMRRYGLAESENRTTRILSGLNPDFTQGTRLKTDDLQDALEITADELYAGRFLEGNPNISQGMITDVTTAVNKHYAQERNILFFDPTSEDYIDDIIRQSDNVNTNKVITGVVDMTDPSGKIYLERAIQTIEEGGIKDAVIPIGAPGHQMTLIKQGDEWTVLDQYAYAEPAFKETKDVVIGIVGKNTGSKEKVITNIGQVCDNTTGSCALFSQGMGRIVLEETDGIKIADEVRYLNNSKQQMNQSIVDDIIDQMDRDVGLRVLDMLE